MKLGDVTLLSKSDKSGKPGFSVDLYDDLHSIAVYDPSETREFEAEGRKFVSEQRA